MLTIVGWQVKGKLVVTPNNTAVLTGQRAVLLCRSDNSGFGSRAITWSRPVDGGASELIATGCRIASEFLQLYSLDSENTGHCDLVIDSTTAAVTGDYTCSEPNLQAAQASLTAIGQLFDMFQVSFLVSLSCRTIQQSLVPVLKLYLIRRKPPLTTGTSI